MQATPSAVWLVAGGQITLNIQPRHGRMDQARILRWGATDLARNQGEEKLEKSVIYRPLCANRDVKLKIDFYTLLHAIHRCWSFDTQDQK